MIVSTPVCVRTYPKLEINRGRQHEAGRERQSQRRGTGGDRVPASSQENGTPATDGGLSAHRKEGLKWKRKSRHVWRRTRVETKNAKRLIGVLLKTPKTVDDRPKPGTQQHEKQLAYEFGMGRHHLGAHAITQAPWGRRGEDSHRGFSCPATHLSLRGDTNPCF